MNELDIEDEEYLHDLIDEIIHVEGRWDTNERKIMWKDTQSPMTHVQVREYFAQCQCGQMNYLHRYAGVEDKENNPVKEAFIEKRTDEEIDEMIEQVVMESESKI